jgi:hypothetical protein
MACQQTWCCASVGLAYPREDFLALKLVQLSRRLLEVETRLVTWPGHVCAREMLLAKLEQKS